MYTAAAAHTSEPSLSPPAIRRSVTGRASARSGRQMDLSRALGASRNQRMRETVRGAVCPAGCQLCLAQACIPRVHQTRWPSRARQEHFRD